MDELRPFYEAMLDRMPTIMDHLAKLPIDGISSEDDNLLRLALSYVEISRCFEAWNKADVRADFFPPKYLHTAGCVKSPPPPLCVTEFLNACQPSTGKICSDERRVWKGCVST